MATAVHGDPRIDEDYHHDLDQLLMTINQYDDRWLRTDGLRNIDGLGIDRLFPIAKRLALFLTNVVVKSDEWRLVRDKQSIYYTPKDFSKERHKVRELLLTLADLLNDDVAPKQ